jgi:hypothetical protein
MNQSPNELPASKEARLQLALQAIEKDATLSQRRAAAIYNVSQKSISNRHAGKQFRRDCAPNSAKLRLTEEEVIVQHILDLDARGFSPRLAAVKDSSNYWDRNRDTRRIFQRWQVKLLLRAPNFVSFLQQFELRIWMVTSRLCSTTKSIYMAQPS